MFTFVVVGVGARLLFIVVFTRYWYCTFIYLLYCYLHLHICYLLRHYIVRYALHLLLRTHAVWYSYALNFTRWISHGLPRITIFYVYTDSYGCCGLRARTLHILPDYGYPVPFYCVTVGLRFTLCITRSYTVTRLFAHAFYAHVVRCSRLIYAVYVGLGLRVVGFTFGYILRVVDLVCAVCTHRCLNV